MGFVPDLRTISGDAVRAVSDGAIEQLAARFDGLPRPLLAAIGAGDLAVEHLAVLREGVRQQVDGIELDGQEIVAAAAGVAASVQLFAGELPRRLQEMAAELPGRVAALTRVTGEIDPTAVVSTLEAYTEAAGVIYGGLARRGDRIWSDARGGSARPGTVVDAAPDRAAATPRSAAPRAARSTTAAPRAAAPGTAVPKAAAPKAAAPKAAAPKAAVPKAAAPKRAAAVKAAPVKAAPTKAAAKKAAPRKKAAGAVTSDAARTAATARPGRAPARPRPSTG